MDKWEKLREAAKKATGGKWSWEDSPPTVYADRTDTQHGLNLFGMLELDWNGENNLNYLVEASPENILELLKERDELLNQLVVLKKAFERRI